MQLVLSQITHSYPDSTRNALSNVDLRFEKGTVSCLMGPSGSGKSTLLSIAAGLFRPTAGTTALYTDEPTRINVLQQSTAWIFQANYMLPRRTALANVALAAATRGLAHKDVHSLARLELAKVGLQDRADAPIENLSGGEVQRVAIARAFLQDRLIIVADEPTGQLDRTNTELVAAALLQAATAGRIVIVATHDPFLASQLDRTIVLTDGQVTSEQVNTVRGEV